MKLRTLATLSIVPVVLLALSACSGPAPHVPTAAERCTPKTATVQWGSSQSDADATLTPVRATVFDYSADGSYTTQSHVVAPKVSISWDEPGLLTFTSHTVESAWDTSLLVSLRRTGRVPSTFGAKVVVPASTLTPNARTGEYLVSDSTAYLDVPFTLSCSGVKPATGHVLGPTFAGFSSLLVKCDEKAGAGSNQQLVDAVALAAKYCAKS
jgi:hypothetical protein